MPEIGEGARLLERLLTRYPRPGDADRAMGWRANTTSVYKKRGEIPARHWDAVRAMVDPPAGSDPYARLKDSPELLQHVIRQVDYLAEIPRLRDEIRQLREQVARLEQPTAAPEQAPVVREVEKVVARGAVARAARRDRRRDTPA